MKDFFMALRWLVWDWIPGLLEERKQFPHTTGAVMFLGFCMWVSAFGMWQYNAWANDLGNVQTLAQNVEIDLHEVKTAVGELSVGQVRLSQELICFQMESEIRNLEERIHELTQMDAPRESDSRRLALLRAERGDMQTRRDHRGCLD